MFSLGADRVMRAWQVSVAAAAEKAGSAIAHSATQAAMACIENEK